MSQTRLFVGNLPSNFNENELRSVFSNYGEVTNLDIKSKPAADSAASTFAFVTISSANNEVEACIRHFSNTVFNGSKLYVTRARESFLERLQRERQQNDEKEAEKKQHKELHTSKKHPIVKLGDKLNPRKRKVDFEIGIPPVKNFKEQNVTSHKSPGDGVQTLDQNASAADKKKLESNKKRIESMQQKRQEFKSKQQIIKTGLIGIDKKMNKKLRFSDTEDDALNTVTQSSHSEPKQKAKTNTLFEDDDSDGEVNFEIKKQFEGKKGQKVLDLQSRYKSDKRFVLDERFIEDDQTENEDEADPTQLDGDPSEHIDVTRGDEKSKQIKILEDVLGVTIKSHANKPDKDKKIKPSMGMIRFDPLNPEHAKFVVPVEEIKQAPKKSKKIKNKEIAEPTEPLPEPPKVEVSKEQFYKIEITKEAFEKPAEGFSLRSLFARDDGEDTSTKDQQEQNASNIPVHLKKQQKVRNPLDPGERNPFVYDSSESEAEDEGAEEKKTNADKSMPEVTEVKAVWKENLFFSKNDIRLKEGLAFFNNVSSSQVQKERRELKSVMKKRINNTERKNQMFKKKIGGRKKSMKKSYKKH